MIVKCFLFYINDKNIDSSISRMEFNILTVYVINLILPKVKSRNRVNKSTGEWLYDLKLMKYLFIVDN